MKYKIIFALSILLIALVYIYNAVTPSKEYPGELIRFDSAATANGSVFTNGGWSNVGKVYIPKGYVAGPFQVK